MKRCFLTAFAVLLCLAVSLSFGTAASADGFPASSGVAYIGVPINETNFPDAAFRAYVRGFDTDGDGMLSGEEIAEIVMISISGGYTDDPAAEARLKEAQAACFEADMAVDRARFGLKVAQDIGSNVDGAAAELARKEAAAAEARAEYERVQREFDAQKTKIASLKGIEYFTALETLSCTNNSLTELDVSGCTSLQMLACGLNQLKELNVSGCTALQDLYCHSNQLTTLDVSQNENLYFLSCVGNEISSLDLSGNPALELMLLSENNLTSLDVSNQPHLKLLNCTGNELTQLDVSANPELMSLTCVNNKLEGLTLNHENLYTLICGANPMQTLDIGGCPKLLNGFLNGRITEEEVYGEAAYSYYGPDSFYTEYPGEREQQLLFDQDITLYNGETVLYSLTNEDGSCTVTYNANGGICPVESVTVEAGGTISTLPTAARDGYVFKGWSESSTASAGITGSYTPNRNITLYAVWTLEGYVASGTWGSLYWTLDDYGVLRITTHSQAPVPGGAFPASSGVASPEEYVMDDFSYDSESAWRAYKDQIVSVSLGLGIPNIGAYAFARCAALTSIQIPLGLSDIGNFAFNGCGALSDITIPEGVEYIGKYAFTRCDALESITIPRSVVYIGEGALALCGGLTNITVAPDNPVYCDLDGVLIDLYQGTLINYPIARSGEYTIPEDVYRIGMYAFEECTGLTKITIPTGVKGIGYMAFDHCTGLTSVTLPYTVRNLGAAAFQFCDSLTSVTIPVSVTVIGQNAFYGTALTDVYYGGSAEDWNAIYVWVGNDPLLNAEIHFSTPQPDLVLPADLTTIGSEAFAGGSYSSVFIPWTTEEIADDAFGDRDELDIFGYPGSAAQDYAERMGYAFYPVAIQCES